MKPPTYLSSENEQIRNRVVSRVELGWRLRVLVNFLAKGSFFFSPYYRSAVETIFYGFFCYLSIMLLFTRPQKMNGLVVRRSRSLYCSVCFGTRVSLSMAYEYPGSHMI